MDQIKRQTDTKSFKIEPALNKLFGRYHETEKIRNRKTYHHRFSQTND